MSINMPLSMERERSKTRSCGKLSAISLAIVLLMSRFDPDDLLLTPIGVLVLLMSVVYVPRFLFHGSTVISMSLTGASRRLFQITVSALVPLILSGFFLRSASSISFRRALELMVGDGYPCPPPVIVLALIGFISWDAAELLDEEHPFRGFLIACAIIFAICLVGYEVNRIPTGLCDTFGDEEGTPDLAGVASSFFVQFMAYTISSYGAMLIRLLRRKAP